MRKIHYKAHIIAAIITISIFTFIFFLTSFIQNRGIENIEQIERSVALDILSIETQFQLFERVNCEDIKNISFSSELGEIGSRLATMESNRDVTPAEINPVKKYYALLEIKDYQLWDEIGHRCGVESPSILYFYEDDCDDCRKQGHILSRMKQDYPDLRVYSFDRNIEGFNAIQTIAQIFQIDQSVHNVPILVLDGHVFYGFQDIDAIALALPHLDNLRERYAVRENILDWAQESLDGSARDFEIKKSSVDIDVYEIKYRTKESWFADEEEKNILIKYSAASNDEEHLIEQIEPEYEEDRGEN